MKSPTKAKSAEMLTRWSMGSRSYEVWSTPEVKPPFRVAFLVNGHELNSHPFTTEVRARAGFEKLVESAVNNW